jgi:hypothetical protein
LQIKLGPLIGIADELTLAADDRTHYRKRCTFFLADIVGSVEAGEPDHELVCLSAADAIKKLRHESQRWAVAKVMQS